MLAFLLNIQIIHITYKTSSCIICCAWVGGKGSLSGSESDTYFDLDSRALSW